MNFSASAWPSSTGGCETLAAGVNGIRGAAEFPIPRSQSVWLTRNGEIGISAVLKLAGVITPYVANGAGSVGKTALEPCMMQLAAVPGIESLEAEDGGSNGGLPGSDFADDDDMKRAEEEMQES